LKNRSFEDSEFFEKAKNEIKEGHLKILKSKKWIKNDF
jgi:hypothetical protein